MIVRIVRMHFKEGSSEEFLELFSAVKNEILEFEGCSHLELWQEVDSPLSFTTYSLWTGEDALEKYRKSEFFKSTWAKTKLLFSEKPDAVSYTKSRYSLDINI